MSLKEFKYIMIYSQNQSGIRLKINNREITRKVPKYKEIKQTFLNNTWIKEITRET